MQEIWKYGNRDFITYFARFVPHPDIKWVFWIFSFLEKSQPALRGVTGDLLQNNLRFRKTIS